MRICLQLEQLMSTTVKMLRHFCYQTYRTNVIFKNPNVFQISYRGIHCNLKLQRKMFLEHENKYAYSVMENKGYATNFLALTKQTEIVSKQEFNNLLQEDWSKKNPKEIFEAFPEFGQYSSENGLCISNSIFDSYIDALTDNIKHASDQELRSLFHYLLCWPETESIRTRNYIEVWVALDDECINRMKQRWSFDEMLTFISEFYMLNVTRASDFSFKSLQKMASKAKQLTPNQIVQTLFFIGIMRNSPSDIHNLELQMDTLFKEFSIEELAIMSMGFFKSKTPIRNMKLISKIISKIIEQSKDVHEVSLAALLKIVRYSMKINSIKMYEMLNALQHEVPRLSVMCNVHVALVGTATLTMHRECLTKIADLATSAIDQARLKDMERFVLAFGIFNLITKNTNCFFDKVMEELRKPQRLQEIEKHGRSFACCVAYLGHLQIYPVDLMNKVLSPEFLQHTYGKQVMTYGREVLSIHNTAKIFCPEADMCHLTDKSAVILAKRYTDFVPDENYKKQYNVSEKLMLDVIKTLRENRGAEEFVVGEHIVTHHQRGDIIVCNNRDGLPVEVAKHFSSAQFGTLRRAPDDNIWVALVIAGKNALIENTNIATGPFQAKLRELEALGFRAALVLWSKYSTLDTKEAKTNYLNNLIHEAIHKKKLQSTHSETM